MIIFSPLVNAVLPHRPRITSNNGPAAVSNDAMMGFKVTQVVITVSKPG